MSERAAILLLISIALKTDTGWIGVFLILNALMIIYNVMKELRKP